MNRCATSNWFSSLIAGVVFAAVFVLLFAFTDIFESSDIPSFLFRAFNINLLVFLISIVLALISPFFNKSNSTYQRCVCPDLLPLFIYSAISLILVLTSGLITFGTSLTTALLIFFGILLVFFGASFASLLFIITCIIRRCCQRCCNCD